MDTEELRRYISHVGEVLQTEGRFEEDGVSIHNSADGWTVEAGDFKTGFGCRSRAITVFVRELRQKH